MQSSTSPQRRTWTADRSARCFVTTHALGTYVLLEAARTHALRYLQVSTDEVYGSIEQGTSQSFPPCALLALFATKTGADLLVQSYFHTYALPALICRGSNNYAPTSIPRSSSR